MSACDVDWRHEATQTVHEKKKKVHWLLARAAQAHSTKSVLFLQSQRGIVFLACHASRDRSALFILHPRHCRRLARTAIKNSCTRRVHTRGDPVSRSCRSNEPRHTHAVRRRTGAFGPVPKLRTQSDSPFCTIKPACTSSGHAIALAHVTRGHLFVHSRALHYVHDGLGSSTDSSTYTSGRRILARNWPGLHRLAMPHRGHGECRSCADPAASASSARTVVDSSGHCRHAARCGNATHCLRFPTALTHGYLAAEDPSMDPRAVSPPVCRPRGRRYRVAPASRANEWELARKTAVASTSYTEHGSLACSFTQTRHTPIDAPAVFISPRGQSGVHRRLVCVSASADHPPASCKAAWFCGTPARRGKDKESQGVTKQMTKLSRAGLGTCENEPGYHAGNRPRSRAKGDRTPTHSDSCNIGLPQSGANKRVPLYV